MSRPLISVTIKGDLARDVAKALESRRGEIERAVEQTGEEVQRTAATLVPVSSEAPHVRDKIVVKHDGLNVEVGVFDDDFHYATFLEAGTSKMPARPFMLPAFERERADFTDRLKRAIE